MAKVKPNNGNEIKSDIFFYGTYSNLKLSLFYQKI